MRRQKLDLKHPILAQAAVAGATDKLAISGLRAWRVKEPDSGRKYTVVRVESRGGEAGFGEGGPATAAEVTTARAAITGRRATAVEYVRGSLAAIPALEAAVSNAMLDLMARSCKVPVYQYLGGPVRFKARLLAGLEGEGDSLARAQQRGFRAFTLRIPPRETMTRLQAYVDAVRKQIAAFKALTKSDAEIVLDAAGALLPGDAASIARAVESVHPIWFDEPTSIQTMDALARITDETVVPVGLGRHVTDLAWFQNILRIGCIDVIRPSLAFNSIHKIKRLAVIAETHYVATAPYHDGGPVATMFGIHLGAAIPNFYTQQVPVPKSARDAAMRAELLSGVMEAGKDGFAELVNQPGLGVRVNEQALAKYAEETL